MRLFFLVVGQERYIEIPKSIGYVLQNNVTEAQREASVMPIGRDGPLD